MKPINEKVSKILKDSFRESFRLGGTSIQPEHLMLALLNHSDNNVVNILGLMGFSVEDLIAKIEGFMRLKIKNPQIKVKLLSLNQDSKRIINISELECDKLGDKKINEEHLMLSLLKDKELDCTKVLFNQGLDYKLFKQKITEIKKQINMNFADDHEETSNFKSNRGDNSKSTTPILDNFGRDITEIAMKGGIDPIIGREAEIERVSQILSRRKKNNPIVIGEPGCVLADTKITVRKISDLTIHTFIDK